MMTVTEITNCTLPRSVKYEIMTNANERITSDSSHLHIDLSITLQQYNTSMVC